MQEINLFYVKVSGTIHSDMKAMLVSPELSIKPFLRSASKIASK